MSLLKDARKFVADNVGPGFHDKRLDSLQSLKLDKILKRKNPYLFRAKAVATAGDLVKQLLDAHLSSNEETIFGDFLEQLAIFISAKAYGGTKSTSEGIDLEFSNEDRRYVVSIKSGPNWGNSRQIAKMIDDFNRTRKIAGVRAHVIAVNGCCYGQDSKPEKEKGNYLKLCGQEFWSLISGDADMYKEIVEPLGFQAKQKNDEFYEKYAEVVNLFTKNFIEKFCLEDGKIDWSRLVEFNSAKKQARGEA